MKTIIVTIAAALISLSAAAYEPGSDPDKYCVINKNGKIVVEYKGRPITSDVTLKDGLILKTNGTVVMVDGSVVTLKEGECFNEDNMSDVIKSKPKKEKRSESEPERKDSETWDQENKEFNKDPETKDLDKYPDTQDTLRKKKGK